MSTGTPRERFVLKAGPGRGTTSRAAWLPTTSEMPEEVPTRPPRIGVHRALTSCKGQSSQTWPEKCLKEERTT